MKRTFLFIAIAAFVVVAGVGIYASGGAKQIREFLNGYEEVPALSTPGRGELTARINKTGTEVEWELTYSDLETPVTQSHIHFGQKGVNGGISVFLCSNLGNGPAGTPACPTPSGTVSGTFDAVDVIGPAAQGIAPGDWDEFLDALRAGATYVNIHTTGRPGGEVRSQIDMNRGDHGKGHH
jgi:hypothetical protein